FVAAAAVFVWVFNPQYGPANEVLGLFGIGAQKWLEEPCGIFELAASAFGITLPAWLAGPSLALLVLSLVTVWHYLGYQIVIFLPGLSNISQDFYEAARLDVARAIPLERALPRFSARPRVGTIAKHAVLIVVAVLVAYPFYFMVTSSFKDVLEAARTPPTIFPTELHPENYIDAWNRAPWGRYFVNTIFVSVTVTVLEL